MEKPENPPSHKTEIIPFKQELDAMENCALSFDQLNDEQRLRVILWLSNRYRLRMGGW